MLTTSYCLEGNLYDLTAGAIMDKVFADPHHASQSLQVAGMTALLGHKNYQVGSTSVTIVTY